MEFFYVVKATQKSGKQDAVIWFTAKSEARAALTLDVELEEAGIETGRGKEYAKPVRTDFPVFNDLPEESTIDYTWCERYTLADDQRTWNVIPGEAQSAQSGEEVVEGADTTVVDGVDIETGEIVGDVNSTETVCDAVREFRERELPVLTTVATLPFRQRLLAQYIADKQYFYHVDEEQKKAILELELDVDNSYVQNMILAAENVDGFKKAHEPDIWKVVNALKTIFPVDVKRTELSVVIQFFKAWFSTEHIDRGILTREWAAGNRINNVQRTDAGTNADGGYVTDRGADAHHTLDTLDLEIACALLPMDFNHREIPGSIARRGKDIVANKEEPWKSWSKILRNQPGILAVNRAAIFNLVRIAPEKIHLNPVAHLEFVNQTMTAEFNAATELLPLPAPAAEPEVPSTQPGGGGKTDRNPNYKPDFDGLDTEIALATLPADFNIYDIPSDVFRQAKAIVAAKDRPFKEWSEALRATPGVLNYSRAAIFALIRSAHPEHYKQPGRLAGYINANLTETDHENPSAEMLAAARHTPEVSWEKEINEKIEAEKAALSSQPQVANLGGGVFSIEGLMNEKQPENDDRSPVNEETTSDVQMETTDPAEGEGVNAVPPGESTDAADPQTDFLNPAEVLAAAAPELANATQPEAEPAALGGELMPQESIPGVEFPAYFEPGRYEGLPNNVYHAANGISSTQVKDARVSLMFYHGRHVTKTILRESSEALTFGSLAHTLALEPEKLHEEFAVFPGVPEGAFTTTDSMKAFIREFNADKPKAEQLKLTGKKEELQAAIRAVNPDAIFADEHEQQWRDSVAGKTILSNEQLALATAIQQALLNHESAGKLLRHPSRSVETSYFGMDDETGLEVRVRPDLEVEINGVRIGVDLKTISMGRVKQDGLRAKLHREIIDRDYHLSAGMYCSVADFDQFFWIFVNKDEGYHWVAVIEASEDLLALGTQEYQKTMRALAQAYDTNCWPAPITEDYTDELNDLDLRRLEALRLA
ncbi:RecE family exodeoxyribonuclease [Leclercia sp.]|uniref:RecE family exodeoxyribonuclease n=1 Tax=Leclercia sp. TaxID=1898428 RepID=UPI002FDDF406